MCFLYFTFYVYKDFCNGYFTLKVSYVINSGYIVDVLKLIFLPISFNDKLWRLFFWIYLCA